MRLTMMTDYALRLLMYVGQHPDRLCTIAEVASVHAISEAHMMKVTHKLGLGGWLETVRGKGGGIRLALAPEEINIGAVIRNVEPDFFLVECLTGDEACILNGHCGLTGIINGALRQFLQHLDQYSLADLIATSPQPARIAPPKLRRLTPIAVRK